MTALFSCLMLLAVALVGSDAAQAQAQSASRIAAVVNNDIISTQDLRERLRLALLFSGLPGDAETQRRLAPQVLRRVIDERLQLQEAERRGIVIQPQEVAGAMQNAAAANSMTNQQLRAFLAEQGVEPEALERQLEAELAWVRLVRRQFSERIVVTDQQIDLARALAAQGGVTQVLLSEILLPVYDPEDAPQVIAEAEDLREAVREGADFEAVAAQVSAAGSRDTGGDLGWVPLNGLQESLRDVIAALGPGQVSDPVSTPSGVQLFFVRDRRIAGDDVSPDLRRIAQLLFPVAPDASESVVASILADASDHRGRGRDLRRRGADRPPAWLAGLRRSRLARAERAAGRHGAGDRGLADRHAERAGAQHVRVALSHGLPGRPHRCRCCRTRRAASDA